MSGRLAKKTRMPGLLSLLLLAATAVPALADGHHDHDRAREALRRGEILPLARILEIVEDRTGGRVMEVDLDREEGRYVYEIDVMTGDGRIVELEIEAATGSIIESDCRKR